MRRARPALEDAFWGVAGVAIPVVSIIVAFALGRGWYVIGGGTIGCTLAVLNLTRWRREDRAPAWPLFAAFVWPAILLGAYWYVQREEGDRKMRIIREVMES